MPKAKFTPSFLNNAACPANMKRIIYSDDSVKGLVMEVRASGGRTFYVRYRDKDGAQRNLKIGDATSISLAAARTRTIEVMSQIALGRDPQGEKRSERQIPLFGDFARGRYLGHVKGYKRSWKCDEILLRVHVEPLLGKKRLDNITIGDVTALHHGIVAKGLAAGTANRILVLVRYVFNLAIKWGVEGMTQNPSKGVDLFKLNNERQTFLSHEELGRLMKALQQSANIQLYSIVRFMLLTGARKQEALKAGWADIDFQHKVWVIPITKSGRERKVQLSDFALQLLEALPSRGNSDHLFPNPDTGRPYHTIFVAWNTARKRAGMPEFRIHDLRHSFASFLVNSGRSIFEVQTLLGHSNIKTTQRYAHLANETLSDAVNRAAAFAFSGEAAAPPLIEGTASRTRLPPRERQRPVRLLATR
ncbi:site-specific integrase [Devosia naphthalenivorans]|uniref:site-specific integrase n=1 Tax=Devosia naphthalenivorans TaxID=2082392 RepID=UPI000D372238|nr:site-specific integrase [Devosia naphthalenivorans]